MLNGPICFIDSIIVISLSGFFSKIISSAGIREDTPKQETYSSCHFSHIALFASPAIRDTNDDGIPDIVIGRLWSGLIYGFDGRTGRLLWDFYVPTNLEMFGVFDSIQAPPAISDINNDGKNDIVFATVLGKIVALSLDGLVTIWPSYGNDSKNTRNIALTDADGDGISNSDELMIGINPKNVDSDGDGMPDGFELYFGLDPNNGGDGISDTDWDFLSNANEYIYGTSPKSWDTDGDGIPDGIEVACGFNPRSPLGLELVVFYAPLIILMIAFGLYLRKLEKYQTKKTTNPKKNAVDFITYISSIATNK